MIEKLENRVTQAIQNAGGAISRKRQCITASYNEHNLGFWLDILMLIETLYGVLEQESSELYGYAFLISTEPLERLESLCRSLAISPQDGGIFLDQAAVSFLDPYLVCEQIKRWPSDRNAAPQLSKEMENIVRIKELKKPPSEEERNFPFRKTILSALGQGQKRNALIIGPAFSGKREGVYRYCEETLGDFPPLSVRFGTGGLNALIDAWSDSIQKLAEHSTQETRAAVPEINRLWNFLFQQRLREEISPFMIQNCRRFFSLLIELYAGIAKQNGVTPIVVTENIHLAEKLSSQIFMNTPSSPQNRHELLILGTADREIPEAQLKNWEKIFPRIIKLSGENSPPPSMQMPPELREIAYSLVLFNRCFPAHIYLRLMREEGKNPAMIKRALSMLYAQGIIDSVDDPRLRIKKIPPGSKAVPKEKKEFIRAMVRRRLLARVKQGNLNPCFNLLIILVNLNRGESPDDELILKSIYADLVNGTVREIEKAINSGLLKNIAGADRAAAIIYIYKTMRALLTGEKNKIKAAFGTSAPDCSSFPVLKAQSLANLSAYQVGMRDIKSAHEMIKETILLSQGKNGFCLAEAYRLFALVSLTRQQSGETADYLNFAIENAEKSGNSHELGISAYYASVAQFLFGNVSKAIRLAGKACEHTLAAGLPEWADRARFFEGRLAFEIGTYREALDIFETLREKPSGGLTPEKDRLLAAWAYRARVFSGNPLVSKPEKDSCDSELFEMEAAYLAGDYRKTIELANALTPPAIDENFIFTEQPDWRSGFAQCELLYFSQEEIWKRMICAYHSLALCRISSESGEEAKNNIRRIVREEQLSEMDPWDAFYFYAWYRILEHTDSEQIDRDTAISKAFKRLRSRASKIDDIEIRQQFLSRPRWNGELSLVAKQFKLI